MRCCGYVRALVIFRSLCRARLLLLLCVRDLLGHGVEQVLVDEVHGLPPSNDGDLDVLAAALHHFEQRGHGQTDGLVLRARVGRGVVLLKVLRHRLRRATDRVGRPLGIRAGRVRLPQVRGAVAETRKQRQNQHANNNQPREQVSAMLNEVVPQE